MKSNLFDKESDVEIISVLQDTTTASQNLMLLNPKKPVSRNFFFPENNLFSRRYMSNSQHRNTSLTFAVIRLRRTMIWLNTRATVWPTCENGSCSQGRQGFAQKSACQFARECKCDVTVWNWARITACETPLNCPILTSIGLVKVARACVYFGNRFDLEFRELAVYKVFRVIFMGMI